MSRTKRWSTADITNQIGRTYLVTGANSGIGLATTAALTAQGARVVMACRNTDKAEAARASLPVESQGRATVRRLDLADLESVAGFVDATTEPVDVLINNAGLMNIPFARTRQGHEMQFGVNVLGHHALTLGLAPQLTDRVVWLGSLAHVIGHVEPDDLSGQLRGYRPLGAYADSKLACIMLAYEWQRRFTEEGRGLRSVVSHPGYTASELMRHSENPLADRFFALGNSLTWAGLSPEKGAWSVLYAATVPDIAGGVFVGPDRAGGLRGQPRITRSNRRSRDRRLAETLWRRCTEMAEFR